MASHCRISHPAESSAEFWEFVLIASPDDSWQGSRGHRQSWSSSNDSYSTRKEYLRTHPIWYEVGDDLPSSRSCGPEELGAKKNLVNTFGWELMGLDMWLCHLLSLWPWGKPCGTSVYPSVNWGWDIMQKAFEKYRSTNKMSALKHRGGRRVLKKAGWGDLVALLCERLFPGNTFIGRGPTTRICSRCGAWAHARQNAQRTVCVSPLLPRCDHPGSQNIYARRLPAAYQTQLWVPPLPRPRGQDGYSAGKRNQSCWAPARAGHCWELCTSYIVSISKPTLQVQIFYIYIIFKMSLKKVKQLAHGHRASQWSEQIWRLALQLKRSENTSGGQFSRQCHF